MIAHLSFKFDKRAEIRSNLQVLLLAECVEWV